MADRDAKPSTRRREPAYARIERHLWELLDSGAGINEAMPSEVDLSREFGVSIMTVRQAYNALVNAGAVTRKPFRGTWAVTHITDDLGQLTGRPYTETWQADEITSEVLTFDQRETPEHIAKRFGVAPGTVMTYLERLRRADGQPVAWDGRWMPAELFERTTREDFEKAPVFTVLARAGVRVTIMQSDINARLADPTHAIILEIERGEPLLVRQSIAMDTEPKVRLVSTSLYPARRYTFRSVTPVVEGVVNF
ncbi:transcriptional regulator, GntR family [Micromonospora pallida]|uniref:Transcriptional regulator, GntR family n=1 Tax=Micromonospora pallida TaxID=145854 RepID=A0A1C6SFQ4_9ACTN|nr:GntR family transcriptional regulator [Micromonospora pallida]SCL28233.1 transcriptional regulator, GntR family [Micromonospora pallida]